MRSGLVCLKHGIHPKLVCFNQSCKECRFQCINCIKEGTHVSHPQDQEDPSKMRQYITQIENESENLRNNLLKKKTRIIYYFQFLLDGIQKKYKTTDKNLFSWNTNKLHSYFSELIQFKSFEETIQIQIEQSCQNFIDQLEKLYFDLNLHELQYFMYDSQDQTQSEVALKVGYYIYRHTTNYEEAINFFDKSLYYYPKNQNSLWAKAESLRKLNYYNEAIIWADKSLKQDSKHCYSIWCKAHCLRKLGQYQESIIYANQSLQINPKEDLSLFCKAMCLCMLGQYKEAIILANKVLEYVPKHLGALRVKSYSLLQLKMFPEAINVIEHSLSIGPNNIKSLMVKGECLKDQKQYQEALTVYKKALEINPDYQWAKDRIAECLEALNQI